MDYTTLVADKSTPASIANWANYALAPATEVLNDAQTLIYQTLRVREMKSPLTALQIACGATTAPLPAGFLDPISLVDNNFVALAHRDEGSLLRRLKTDASGNFIQSIPRSYAIFGETYNFDCAANAAFSYWQIFYQTPPFLGPDVNTNFLTNRYSHILRAAVLAVAADFRKDDADYQRCSSRLAMLIADAKAKDDLVNRNISVDADYSGDY